MTVMPGKIARAARAREALTARHAELRGLLNRWAGGLAVPADRGDPVVAARNLPGIP